MDARRRRSDSRPAPIGSRPPPRSPPRRSPSRGQRRPSSRGPSPGREPLPPWQQGRQDYGRREQSGQGRQDYAPDHRSRDPSQGGGREQGRQDYGSERGGQNSRRGQSPARGRGSEQGGHGQHDYPPDRGDNRGRDPAGDRGGQGRQDYASDRAGRSPDYAAAAPKRGARRSPDREAERGGPPDRGSRRSPERGGQRSPEYTPAAAPKRGARRSPPPGGDRGGRPSPAHGADRGGRRSPDYSGRDRSPERGGRRSPDYSGRACSRSESRPRRSRSRRGRDQTREEVMNVPPSSMGRIIGKAGDTVKQLRQDSGAKIDIKTKEEPGIIRLSGSNEAVAKARRMIEDILDKPDDRGGGGGGGGGRGPPRSEGGAEEMMSVPPNQIGRIIGKGGEMIMQLQGDSGAKIDIVKDQPGTVRLSGDREAIGRARRLIEDLMDKEDRHDGDGRSNDGPRNPQRVEETMEVPTAMMGRIIGKGGETIQQLQRDSGAKVDTKKDKPGYVWLAGSSEDVEEAKRMILALVNRDDQRQSDGRGNDAPRNSNRAEETMEVPTAMMGRIIGKGGETIQQMARDSGAKIDTKKDQPGYVWLSGSKEDVEGAKRMILALINRDDDRNSGGRTNDSRGGYQQPSRIEETMMVPQSIMGRIIGKGGEKIMELQKESGAKIDIKKEEPGVVRLSGSRDSIESAQRLIQYIIDGGEDGKGGGKDYGKGGGGKDYGKGGGGKDYGKDSGKGHGGGGGDDGPQSTESIEIQRSMVPQVVGENGEMVEEFEEKCGVRINIDTSGGAFKLQIKGPKSSVERAQSMIFDKMERAQFKDGGKPPPAAPSRGGQGGQASWSDQGGASWSNQGSGASWSQQGGAQSWSEGGGAASWSGQDRGNAYDQWQSGDQKQPASMYPASGGQKRARSSSSSSSSSSKNKRGLPQAPQGSWPAWGQFPAAGAAVAKDIDMDEL